MRLTALLQLPRASEAIVFGMTTWHFVRKVFVLESNNYKLSCGAEVECCCVGLWCKAAELGDASAASRVSTLNEKDTRVYQTTIEERRAYS
jgi:hypothetical protein